MLQFDVWVFHPILKFLAFKFKMAAHIINAMLIVIQMRTAKNRVYFKVIVDLCLYNLAIN